LAVPEAVILAPQLMDVHSDSIVDLLAVQRLRIPSHLTLLFVTTDQLCFYH